MSKDRIKYTYDCRLQEMQHLEDIDISMCLLRDEWLNLG